VNDQRNVTSRSTGSLTSLNTNTLLYVGGVDNNIVNILPDEANFDDGFQGK